MTEGDRTLDRLEGSSELGGRTRDVRQIVEQLNIVILNMAAKQRVLDSLNSSVFTMKVFSEYIGFLIDVNLELLGIEDSSARRRYRMLIEKYLNGDASEAPEFLVRRLLSDRG